MSYNKNIWKRKDKITKEKLNNIENGIYDAHDKINVIDNKVKQDMNDIKLQIGTEELTTTSKKIKGAINDLSSQIKDNMNYIKSIEIDVEYVFGKSHDAVKNAVSYADANKGTILKFNSGIWEFNLDTNTPINIPNYTTFKGEKNTIFKVVSSEAFGFWFGNVNNQTVIDTTFTNIEFDMNCENIEYIPGSKPCSIIRCSHSENLTIEKCKFKTRGVYCIVLQNHLDFTIFSKNTVIRHNEFLFLQKDPDTYKDNTTVKVMSENALVYGNIFKTNHINNSAGTGAGIELRGRSIKCYNNTFDYYKNGIDIVSEPDDIGGTEVYGNVFRNSLEPIQLWAYTKELIGTNKDETLMNVNIYNNYIHLNPSIHTNRSAFQCTGVILQNRYNYAYKNINIKNNTFIIEDYYSKSFTEAYIYTSGKEGGFIEGLFIDNNYFYTTTMKGIMILPNKGSVSMLNITNNNFKEIGSSTNFILYFGYPINDSLIQNNHIVDTRISKGTEKWIAFEGSEFNNFNVVNNTLISNTPYGRVLNGSKAKFYDFAPKVGTTASRPITTYIGDFYFDTTINKPIWCKQIEPSILWVDSSGEEV